MANPGRTESTGAYPREGDRWVVDGRTYRIDEVEGDRVFYTVPGTRSVGAGSAAWIMSGERVP